MDTTLFTSFVGIAFLASMTPGPNNLLLMSSGAMFGLKRTIPHICGVFIGFNILMLAAIFGLDVVLSKLPWLLTVVKIVGAAWLAWLGFKFLQAAFKTHSTQGTESKKQKPARARPFKFYEAALFQWINPKALIMAVALAGAYVGISENIALRTALICGTFLIFGLLSATTWAVAGSTLNRLMSSGQSAKTLNIIMGLLLMGTAVMILMTKAHA